MYTYKLCIYIYPMVYYSIPDFLNQAPAPASVTSALGLALLAWCSAGAKPTLGELLASKTV